VLKILSEKISLKIVSKTQMGYVKYVLKVMKFMKGVATLNAFQAVLALNHMNV
jgi:hypothetical protein